ncbi:MAG: MBL fold metallo-hydrolase [Ignavibacteria bacterium]|nr:MBL fold metallo-hydrolase [Ignavibacteria bacterium]
MYSILAFECGPVATNCYLVGDTDAKLAFLVDAPKESLSIVLDTLASRGWKLTEILLTHTHWDHTADCHELQLATGARVVVHAEDVYRLTDPMKHTIWPLPFTIQAVTDFETISGTEGHLHVLGEAGKIKWVHTPGHTEGGVCFIDELHSVVYAGDTLFAGSIGRTDLPGGDMKTLCDSIHQVLFCLPDPTTVFPGHGPITTIGDEKISNPFVGLLAS